MTLTPSTLRWVDLEEPPGEARWTEDPDFGHAYVDRYDLTAEARESLTVAEAALAVVLLNSVDEHTCAAAGCERGVGFVLYEDDDNPARSGARWVYTTLVTVGEGHDALVRAVCEDDTPGNVYWFGSVDSAAVSVPA